MIETLSGTIDQDHVTEHNQDILDPDPDQLSSDLQGVLSDLQGVLSADDDDSELNVSPSVTRCGRKYILKFRRSLYLNRFCIVLKCFCRM